MSPRSIAPQTPANRSWSSRSDAPNARSAPSPAIPAALAGSSRVFSELLRAHRAIEVNDLDEMTEVLAVCQGERWPQRPRHFGHHRLGRACRADPRQRHRGRSRPAAAVAGGARRGGARHRPHHRRRQSVRRLGQRQLRRQSAACHVGRRQQRRASTRICYCSDTSNDPVIGHPGARAGKRHDADARRHAAKSTSRITC